MGEMRRAGARELESTTFTACIQSVSFQNRNRAEKGNPVSNYDRETYRVHLLCISNSQQVEY